MEHEAPHWYRLFPDYLPDCGGHRYSAVARHHLKPKGNRSGLSGSSSRHQILYRRRRYPFRLVSIQGDNTYPTFLPTTLGLRKSLDQGPKSHSVRPALLLSRPRRMRSYPRPATRSDLRRCYAPRCKTKRSSPLSRPLQKRRAMRFRLNRSAEKRSTFRRERKKDTRSRILRSLTLRPRAWEFDRAKSGHRGSRVKGSK